MKKIICEFIPLTFVSIDEDAITTGFYRSWVDINTITTISEVTHVTELNGIKIGNHPSIHSIVSYGDSAACWLVKESVDEIMHMLKEYEERQGKQT